MICWVPLDPSPSARVAEYPRVQYSIFPRSRFRDYCLCVDFPHTKPIELSFADMEVRRNRTMEHDGQLPSPSQGGGNRASLACVPCRTRHVRCDAAKPACRRCRAESKQCCYAESRRGGLTRAALAARRTLVANDARTASLKRASQSDLPQPVQTQRQQGMESHSLSSNPDHLLQLGMPLPLTSNTHTSTSTTPTIEDILPDELLNISRDRCIDLYYKHFHRFHPCVLPRPWLEKILQDAIHRIRLRPLIAVMRFIGSLYCQSGQADRRREEANVVLAAQTQPHLQDPFMVQAYFINSIALYWCGEPDRSREEMDRAIRIALELNMQCQGFAVAHGEGDPVLQESWRRTWWQIYIVDAYYAAMKHESTYSAYEVDVTTDLPCEENQYSSGVCILPHRSLLTRPSHIPLHDL